MTLLEQAKRVRRGGRPGFSDDEIELALACFTGSVSQSQVCKTMKIASGGVSSWLYYRIQEAWRRGMLTVGEREK